MSNEKCKIFLYGGYTIFRENKFPSAVGAFACNVPTKPNDLSKLHYHVIPVFAGIYIDKNRIRNNLYRSPLSRG